MKMLVSWEQKLNIKRKQKNRETKNWFFVKIIKFIESSLIRRKREKTELPILGTREVTSVQNLQIIKGQ